MNEPVAAQVNTHMGEAAVPRCPEKNKVARLRLTEPDMQPRIILPVDLAREEYTVLFVHIHNITGAIESPWSCPPVAIRRADIPLGSAYNSSTLTPAANPAVLIKAAPANEENSQRYDCNVQENIFHDTFALIKSQMSKVQSLKSSLSIDKFSTL
jgi:hypothetical protein